MDSLTDDELDAAEERGREQFATQPHARSARYDPQTGTVLLELFNGCMFSFPARQLQGLETASDEQLSTVELIGLGYGVHWEPFDADFTVAGLLAGSFGTAAFMAPHRARLRAMVDDLLNERRDAA